LPEGGRAFVVLRLAADLPRGVAAMIDPSRQTETLECPVRVDRPLCAPGVEDGGQGQGRSAGRRRGGSVVDAPKDPARLDPRRFDPDLRRMQNGEERATLAVTSNRQAQSSTARTTMIAGQAQEVLDYIQKNKEWIFSGIGVLIISALYHLPSYWKRLRGFFSKETVTPNNSHGQILGIVSPIKSMFYSLSSRLYSTTSRLKPTPSINAHGRASGDSLKMVAVIVVALAMLGGSGAFWWVSSKQVPIDQATLCPKAGPTAVHAVLIDRSDPITDLQARRVRQVLNQAILDGPVGAKIALYVADTDGNQALTPLVALCNPGRESNPLYQNPRKIREQFELNFKARMNESINMLLVASRGENSPIMESLKAICIDAFGPVAAEVPLRLTIVSDLIQNSATASHYRDRDYEALLRSPRLQALRADCKGAEVDIIYLLRPTQRGRPSVQNSAHQSFWDRYLQLMNTRPRGLEMV
jgi:hypothetical protein